MQPRRSPDLTFRICSILFLGLRDFSTEYCCSVGVGDGDGDGDDDDDDDDDDDEAEAFRIISLHLCVALRNVKEWIPDMPDEYFRPGPGPITLLDPLDPLYHQDFKI